MSYQFYIDHITAYEREFKPWETRAEKIVKRYRDDKRTENGDATRFNVLWSNVQTLKAATYARTPMPDVSRRFRDNDPVGRVAALLLERALEFDVRHFRDFGASLSQATYDRFLGGRGTAWIRYECELSEEQPTEDADTNTEVGQEIRGEHAPTDYVHWKDFGHQVCRTWEECNIVWRKVYMTKRKAEERFPDVTLPMDSSPDDEQKMRTQDGPNMQALVYEVWDKEAGKAVWLSKSLGKIIDEKDDPLGLEEFFPCPPPIYATLTTDSLIPVPDFTLYQDQATELDTLSDRIDGLIKALQVKGVHDASIPELSRLFIEAGNGTLIPVENWAAFAEKKGLAGAVDIVEILPIAQALAEAYKAFDHVKGQIYELTGISDILRGETAPSETATAQQIKNSYASLRLKVFQNEVEKFATRLLQLKAQVICNHFDPQTIAKLGCAEQLTQADQQIVPLALQMLKSGRLTSFRVEVETDSMAYQDEQQDKQDKMEFIKATEQMLQTMMQMSQEAPALTPLAGELLKFGTSGFKIGKTLEGVIDQAIEQMKQQAQQAAQQPPKPSPEQVKAQSAQQIAQMKMQADQQKMQIEAQADMQADQARAQADIQIAQAKAQAEMKERMAEQAHEAQLEAIKAQNEHAMAHIQQSHEAMLAQMQAHAQQQAANTQAMLQQILQKMKSETAVEVAEIGAQTTLEAAQISAAKAADQ